VEVPIQGDRERLSQVLSNLVGNAVKFTPAGGRIELSLALEDGLARFEVKDNGVGTGAGSPSGARSARAPR